LNLALTPFRTRVNMSAIGSLTAIIFSYYLVSCYQLDLTTPGSFPADANTRKQIRQSPNFLR
ncbi:MAG: hypothetical protein KAS40_23935, partial [Desulfobacterales bacterium]|nr:hypothetical protein [Desulfobacterales bacterium]